MNNCKYNILLIFLFSTIYCNSIEIGDSCLEAFDYGDVNGPSISGSIDPNGSYWVSFELSTDYSILEINTCDSEYDTYLEFWSDCDSGFKSRKFWRIL